MRKISFSVALSLTALLLFVWACKKNDDPDPNLPYTTGELPYATLSEYQFFSGSLADLKPNNRVVPYDLNMPLFSDYAHKARFVYVPEGQKAVYKDNEAFDFPANSALIKNFYFPQDFRNPNSPRKIIETRVLINRDNEWLAFTYKWNDAQTEATLLKGGADVPVTWIDDHGVSQSISYGIPNQNQCKSCHNANEIMKPIGPKARNLNRVYAYSDGSDNQLTRWTSGGYLTGAPAVETVPRFPAWADSTDGTIETRARAYLDVNCSHCHSEKGPANNSGLWLTHDETRSIHLGICKLPVSAGAGSGGHRFDVLPGKPDESTLIFRMETDDATSKMPEVGRTIVHAEGLKLIRAWVSGLQGKCD